MNDQDLRTSIDFFRTQLESWPLPGLLPVLARLLAAGEPVTVEEMAEAGGWTPREVRTALRGCRGRLAGAPPRRPGRSRRR